MPVDQDKEIAENTLKRIIFLLKNEDVKITLCSFNGKSNNRLIFRKGEIVLGDAICYEGTSSYPKYVDVSGYFLLTEDEKELFGTVSNISIGNVVKRVKDRITLANKLKEMK